MRSKESYNEIHPGSRDPHQVYPSPFKDISNASNISVAANKTPHPTWKHLARLSVSSHATIDDSIGIKCLVEMVVDQYELPCKKLVVSSTDKENYPILAETGFQSASRNELHSLELLGA